MNEKKSGIAIDPAEITSLEDLRKKRDLTQRKLSDLAGINLRLYQKYAYGECAIENMTLSMAKKLASALNVDVSMIVELAHKIEQ